MLPELIDPVKTLQSVSIVGIAIALVGGLFLALGAQFQHRGVKRVEEKFGNEHKTGLSVRQLTRLLTSPWWVLGTVLLGLAILCQLTSLGFAPLIVVQPLGVVALVITSIVNSRISKTELTGPAIRAIVLCVAGVAVFVTAAALVATEYPIDDRALVIVLSILVIVLFLLAIAFGVFRKYFRAIFYVISAGVLYGFVATLAKVVINRVLSQHFDWLTIVGVVALIAAGALGAYFVQTAYSVGSPDLVIAGLTVVDPLVAVIIGVTVLGEASQAPIWILFIWLAAAGTAVYGVFQLSRHQPPADE